MILSHFFKNAWRWKEDLQYNFHLPQEDFYIDTENIENATWSYEFEHYQRNRLILGALRYGRVLTPGRSKYDRVSGMFRYIKEYENTGNLECLVDVANYCMLEFLESDHSLKHFAATDDKFHVKELK